MSSVESIDYEFVKLLPTNLRDGVLYISTDYATAVHLCFCGCRSRVVTPLSPAQWSITFDGESVSLSPSVGSHDLECASHYWIRKNQIRWSAAWTAKEVAAGREADRRDLVDLFDDVATDEKSNIADDQAASPGTPRKGRVRRWFAAHRRAGSK